MGVRVVGREFTERLLSMTWVSASPRGGVWQPPTDVYETRSEMVVRVELAGVRIEDVDVSVSDRLLTISGVRRPELPEDAGYHRMEILYGPFRTTVALPHRVNLSGIAAEYRDGFLTVRIPKAGAVKVPVSAPGD